MNIQTSESNKRTHTLRMSEREVTRMAAEVMAQRLGVDIGAAHVSVKGDIRRDSGGVNPQPHYLMVYITEDFGPRSTENS